MMLLIEGVEFRKGEQMRENKTKYTSVCDKCGKTESSDSSYPALRSIYLNDMRGAYASSDCHQHFMDLCEDCFNDMIEYLGAEDRWKERLEQSKRYRSYD